MTGIIIKTSENSVNDGVSLVVSVLLLSVVVVPVVVSVESVTDCNGVIVTENTVLAVFYG